MKIGGSLIDFEGTLFPEIVKVIKEASEKDKMGPIIVVSAPNGCTDELLDIGNSKAVGKEINVENIFTKYEILAKKVVGKKYLDAVLNELKSLEKECNHTLSILNKRFHGVEKAQLLTSAGEIPVSIILDYALKTNGIKADHLKKEAWPIITDDNFEYATPLTELCVESREKLVNLLKEGFTITQAGFLGMTSDGLETLLGRGGSDQTAVIDAYVLNDIFDVEIKLYKNTPILSSNPMIVEGQFLFEIPILTYNEALKATTMGTKIVQKDAVRLAQEFNIPIEIIPIKEPGKKTVITKDDDSKLVVKVVSGLKGGAIITIDDRVSKSVEDCFRRWENYDEFLDLGTETLSTGEVVRDIFVLDAQFVLNHLNQIKYFDPKLTVKYEMGVVTLVGDKMKHTGGVAATAIGTIPRTNINRAVFAPHTSQIILIVSDKDVEYVMKSIHAVVEEINKRGPGKVE